ncbi:MAG: hypothetical protein IBX62_09545 [Coriobacteriia bacterium]|nr:hypothetical protein [Coriobacteriia bacterium]
MLVPMAKVEIIGPKNLFLDVVSLLHEQGTLHIEDLSSKIRSGEVPLDQMEVYSKQEQDRERMEEMLIRVRAILKALNAPVRADDSARRSEYRELYQMTSEQLSDEVATVIGEVEERTSGLAAAHSTIEAELALLARYEPVLHKVQPLAKQIVTTGSFESVALLVERRYKGALEQLKEELDKLTKKQCEIVSTDVDDDTTAAIVVFAKQYSEAVHKFLAMENVNQIRLPSDFQDMPFDVAYDALKERRKNLPQQLRDVSGELDEMSQRWYCRLATVRDVLVDKLDEISAIPKFGRTEYAFVIDGWLPIEDVGKLRKAIREQWREDIIVNQTEISEKEYGETPVALRNPKALAPFQFLLSAYGTPKYGTLDPTWMLFLFYPLFFGMIVGDLGYGLVMMGIVLWLRFKFRQNAAIQLATAILGPAATMVIAFGFLYQEMFGDLVSHYFGLGEIAIHLGPVTLPFHRVALVREFMVLAIAVGVLHVMFGLAMGLVNAIRGRHRKHIWEKAGILTFLLGVMFAVGVGFVLEGGASTAAQTAFAVAAAGGFIFAIRGGGVMGVVEAIESVAHMASYIRIMAVGLAGAIFADAVNGIVADTGNIIAGAAIGVLLHGLNFIICAFSPTIHALRLNFLEFFGKFYEIGQQEYKPFQKTTGGEKSA